MRDKLAELDEHLHLLLLCCSQYDIHGIHDLHLEIRLGRDSERQADLERAEFDHLRDELG